MNNDLATPTTPVAVTTPSSPKSQSTNQDWDWDASVVSNQQPARIKPVVISTQAPTLAKASNYQAKASIPQTEGLKLETQPSAPPHIQQNTAPIQPTPHVNDAASQSNTMQKQSRKAQKISAKKVAFQEEDLDYMRSTSAAVLESTPIHSRLLMVVLITFILLFFFWASYAELDEVTRGDGQVIPSQKIQVIQNLEGGIIAEILVKEGQIVEKGQILLKIDDNNFESTFMESRLRYLEMLAKSSRLKAEANGEKQFELPPEVEDKAPQLARNEQLLFASRQKALNNTINISHRQTEKYQQELREANSKIGQISRNLKLAKDELNLIKPLFKNGTVSQVKLIQVERQVFNYEAEIDEIKTSLPRLKLNINESEEKEKEAIASYQSKAQEELNNIQAEIPRIKEAIEALEDKVQRTSVRSPVKGTVKQLLINTIDGVVKPGMDLVEIVPMDDKLLIEAKIRPSDIAYIYPGQSAKVKLTAYDSSKYGSLDAKVIFISADTIMDGVGGDKSPFYRVRVKTDTNYLESDGNRLPIIPGMVTQVDILTGKKTVLDYMVKPVVKTKDNAFNER